MTAARWAAVLVVGAILLVGLAALVSQADTAVASSLSPGPSGWLVARRYLEERGDPVTLLDRPVSRWDETGASARAPLVLTFPLTPGVALDEATALRAHLDAGGRVIVAFTGADSAWYERNLLGELGVVSGRLRDEPPLAPGAWRRHWLEETRLEPRSEGGTALTVSTPVQAPAPPRGAEVWYAGADGKLSIFERRVGRGTLFVLPAEALANPRVGGHLELLERLRGRFDTAEHGWVFDEYHHGLIGSEVETSTAGGSGFSLFALQILLLYGLAVWAATRRFSPVWKSPPARVGGTDGFLVGLGEVHDRLGHHDRAARHLVEVVEALDPHSSIPAQLRRRAEEVTDGAGLVALCRAVARLRGRRPPKP